MAEVVLGIKIPDLPEGWQPTEVVVIAKCLLPEGEDGPYPYALATRVSGGLAPWDTAGLLRAATLYADDELTSGVKEGE